MMFYTVLLSVILLLSRILCVQATRQHCMQKYLVQLIKLNCSFLGLLCCRKNICVCILVITNIFEWKTLMEQVAHRVEAKKKHAESDLAESAISASVSAGNNVYLNALLHFFR